MSPRQPAVRVGDVWQRTGAAGTVVIVDAGKSGPVMVRRLDKAGRGKESTMRRSELHECWRHIGSVPLRAPKPPPEPAAPAAAEKTVPARRRAGRRR